MHRSGLDRRASLAQPERLDAVLALVARDLARTWRTRRRMRGANSRKMETVEPSQQQSTRMAAAGRRLGAVARERPTN